MLVESINGPKNTIMNN